MLVKLAIDLKAPFLFLCMVQNRGYRTGNTGMVPEHRTKGGGVVKPSEWYVELTAREYGDSH